MSTKKAIITYAPLALGAITATALMASYIENKKHIRGQLLINEQQRELNELLIAEKRMDLNNKGVNFRNLVNIERFIPTKSSNTEQWCAFYNELKSRYGKTDADLIFTKTWQKRRGGNVNINEVIKCTKLELDRTVLEDIAAYPSTLRSALSFGKGVTSTVVYAGIGIGVIFLGVAIYKFAKSKPYNAGLPINILV